MRNSILLCAILLNAIIWWFVMQNRTSEKIVTAFVGSLVAVGVTIAAAIVFSTIDPISERFEAAFPIDINKPHEMLFLTTRDRSIPFRGFSTVMVNHAIEELRERDPEFVNDPGDKFGQHLYHHVLQRAVLAWMADVFQNSWLVERHASRIPGACCGSTQQGPQVGGAAMPSRVLTDDDIRRILSSNKLADLSLGVERARTLILPPSTNVSVIPPRKEVGSWAEVKFENAFCTLVIKTTESGGGRGLGYYRDFEAWDDWRMRRNSGSIRRPFERPDPIPVEKESNGFVSYWVSVTATFKTIRSGHPDMALQKRWAQDLVRLLRYDWDEEAIYQRTRDRISEERFMR